MDDETAQSPETTEPPAESDAYSAPALADLGSFQELTGFNPSATVTDAELGSL